MANPGRSPRYWLWDWLDENNLRSVEATKRDSLRDLQRRAAEWEPNLSQPLAGASVIAGAGADLHTGLQCPNPACQKNSVDVLFRRVWHYFDQIVIGDNLTHDIAHHWGPATEAELRERLLTRIDVLIHIRRIGAEHLVEFREKGVETENWRHELRKAKAGSLVRASDAVLNSLRRRASVEIKVSGGTAWVQLKDEELPWETSTVFRYRQGGRLTISDLKMDALDRAWRENMLFLAADVAKTRELSSALGCVHPWHQSVLAQAGHAASGSIAFELRFPILDGVPIRTLLKLRRDNGDLFLRFQKRLRDAVAARAGPGRAKDLADEIGRDIIDPELRKIRTALRASEKVLARKSAVGITLGSLVTTCGIIAGASPQASFIGGAAAVAAATQNAAGKYLEERRDIALSDFYFIWQAARHAPGQDQ
jgi:hypothetical protein